jgi:SNF2 family DNA or RNA helicase
MLGSAAGLSSKFKKQFGHGIEVSAPRQKGVAPDKVFESKMHEKTLEVPLSEGGQPKREFLDCLYRAFSPEEKQKVTKKTEELKIEVSKDFGWDVLFRKINEIQNTVEAIKVRHFALLAIMSDLATGQIWNCYDAEEDYNAFKAGTATVPQVVNLIVTITGTSRSYRYPEATSKEGFIAKTVGKEFDEYMIAMNKFMASDSTFILKRSGSDIDLEWVGDGRANESPVPSYNYPDPKKIISKEDFSELVVKRELAGNSGAIITALYSEVYESVFNFLSSVVPGLNTNLHTKQFTQHKLDFMLDLTVSRTFREYLIREWDVINLPKGFQEARGKYLSLLIHRGYNKNYIPLERAKNAQRSAFDLYDKVRCTLSVPVNVDGSTQLEEREVIATMRTWSRNKKKLSVDYQGNEYKITEVKDLRLFLKEGLENLTRPDVAILNAINLSLHFTFKIKMNEQFTRVVTQTVSGKVGFSAMRTWIMIWQKLKFTRSREFKRTPKYILPYSTLASNPAFKSKSSVPAERTDENGMTVDNVGRIIYVPPISDTLPLEYEKTLDELLESSYANNEPFNIENTTSAPIYKLTRSTEEQEARVEGIEKLTRFNLLPLAVNWTTNVVLYPGNSNKNKVEAVNLDGAMKPDVRTMADWMGMPTRGGEEGGPGGKFPGGKPGMLAYSQMTGVSKITEPAELITALFFVEVFYDWLLTNKKVADYDTILQRAKKHLEGIERGPEITEIDTPEIYKRIITDDKFITAGLSSYDNTGNAGSMLKAAMWAANPHNPKFQAVCKSYTVATTDHPCYFKLDESTLSKIHESLSLLLGGALWIELCKECNEFLKDQKALEDLILNGVEIDHMDMLNYDTLSTKIVPQIKIWGVYMPQSDDILLKAHEHKKTLEKTKDYVPEVPGIKEIDPTDPKQEGFALQPHQVDVMAYSASHPRFMILDVAPGGGKTTLGLSEILTYLGEGRIKRPMVMMPAKLIKNWINDCIHVLKAPVNFIPITTQTINNWGREELARKIKDAPPNTIVCVAYKWLSNPTDTKIVMYGVRPVKVLENIEFLKQFDFDYIACDESHNLKNSGSTETVTQKNGKTKIKVKRPSTAHLSVLRLVSTNSVKYIRLLTGTLIKNNLLDLVGQARLLNPAIFRTIDEFKKEYGDPNSPVPTDDGRRIQQEIRNYLEEFVTVVQKKKRHWAFVMPEFVDQFNFVDPDDLAKEYYEWLCKKTIDQIEGTLGADSEKFKNLTNGIKINAEGEDEDEGEDPDDGGEGGGGGDDDGDDEDDESGTDSDDDTPGVSSDVAKIESALNPYLQRLEMALVDPEGDSEFSEFKDWAIAKGYDPRVLDMSPTTKARKVYEIIKIHFEGRYNATDKYGRNLEDQDPLTTIDSLENSNKILIFCKFYRTVDSIYNFMPEQFKKYAAKYRAADSAVLEDFLVNPKLKILVALEDSLQEGHNLQCCSRLIRVEQVWTPGEMEQGVSRVHRPDVLNRFGRTKIVSNWIITNGTLEIAKIGRLIAKSVSKAKFDEADRKYQRLPNLEPICMSFEVLSGRNRDGTPNNIGKKEADDIAEYLEAFGMDYHQTGNVRGLAQFQNEDFEEERIKAKAENRDKMVIVKTKEMPAGSKFIKHLPYVIGQSVYDPNELGLIPLRDYLIAHPELKENLKEGIVGLPVHIAQGEGIIQSIREVSKGFTLKIHLTTGVTLKSIRWDMVYVITKTDTNMKKMLKKAKGEVGPEVSPEPTEKQKRVREKIERLKAQQPEMFKPPKEEKVPKERRKRREKEEEVIVDTTVKQPKLKPKTVIDVTQENEATKDKIKQTGNKDRPVREKEKDKIKPSLTPTKDYEKNLALDVYAMDCNGLPTLLLSHDDPDSNLIGRKLGFTYFGSYLYCELKTRQQFDQCMKGLDSAGFKPGNRSQRVLDAVSNTFVGIQNKEKAFLKIKAIDKRQFFNVNSADRAKVRDPARLSIYPIVEGNDRLALYVDTSKGSAGPMRLKAMKKLPDAPNVKWFAASGIWVYQGQNGQKLLKKIAEFKAVGIKVNNMAEVKADIEALF